MKTVYNTPPFPLLDSLRSSNRLITFEEILPSPIDEDEDYQRLRDENIASKLDPPYLSLVLEGQAVWCVEELPTEPNLGENAAGAKEIVNASVPAEENYWAKWWSYCDGNWCDS